jgi:hypothetical protein
MAVDEVAAEDTAGVAPFRGSTSGGSAEAWLLVSAGTLDAPIK